MIRFVILESVIPTNHKNSILAPVYCCFFMNHEKKKKKGAGGECNGAFPMLHLNATWTIIHWFITGQSLSNYILPVRTRQWPSQKAFSIPLFAFRVFWLHAAMTANVQRGAQSLWKRGLCRPCFSNLPPSIVFFWKKKKKKKQDVCWCR